MLFTELVRRWLSSFVGIVELGDHQPTRSERDDLIIVDDICDTGRTFSLLRQSYPNALYVAAYAKPAGKEYCHYFGRLVDQSQWLVFPFAPSDEVNR
jgi:hypoxanthine phosphoribosyltransferase